LEISAAFMAEKGLFAAIRDLTHLCQGVLQASHIFGPRQTLLSGADRCVAVTRVLGFAWRARCA
jgi:hypothetical protein